MIDKHMKHSKVLYTIFLLIISISAYSQDNFPDVRLGNKQFQKEKLIKYRVQQKGESYGFVNEESKFSIKPKFDNAEVKAFFDETAQMGGVLKKL